MAALAGRARNLGGLERDAPKALQPQTRAWSGWQTANAEAVCSSIEACGVKSVVECVAKQMPLDANCFVVYALFALFALLRFRCVYCLHVIHRSKTPHHRSFPMRK